MTKLEPVPFWGAKRRLTAHPLVAVERQEVTSLATESGVPTILATGPLTSEPLARSLAEFTGSSRLFFYDAIAPILYAESLDLEIIYQKSRYDDGPGDYLNCPLDEDQYLRLVDELNSAQYAPLHIGHYALASTHYCHFTSPIRRYADLMVHRTLECYLQNKSIPKEQEQNLVETGKHITFTEQRAEDAEKELTTVLTLQMLSKKIGDQLDCVVTGLTGFGVFVQCKKFGIEGLIRMAALGSDQWKYNEKNQCRRRIDRI